LISSWMSFWLVSVVPKYLNFATFSNDSDSDLSCNDETWSYISSSLHLFLDQHAYYNL
jgi:hypothetical protein